MQAMQVDSPDRIRNIAVAGHHGTGKTTLVSALLYTGGVTTRLNRVEDGNTITVSIRKLPKRPTIHVFAAL